MKKDHKKLFSVIEEGFAWFITDNIICNYIKDDYNELLVRDREGEINAIATFDNIRKVVNFEQFYDTIREEFIDEIIDVASEVFDKYGI